MSIFLALRFLYGACLLVTAVIGWRFGGRSERWGVAIVVTGTLVTYIVMDPALFDWRSHRAPLVAVDTLALFALLALALRSERFWPMWAAAFHLITLCSHGAIYVLPRRLLQTYAVFQGFWIYPIMLCIVIGALSRRADRVRRDRPIRHD